MVAERLDVRLDGEHRHKLAKILEARSSTVSTVIRTWIDQAYAELEHERRRQAALRLTQMQIEDVPDPQAVKKQLAAAYDLGPLP